MATIVTEQSGKAALVHAVRLAFQRARIIPTEFAKQRRSGRLDVRRVHRFEAANEVNIFKQRLLPGVARVNAHILVDGSSSMTNYDLTPEQKAEHTATGGASTRALKNRINHATDLTATLTDALGSNAAVRLNVWLHNSAAATGDLSIWSIIKDGKGRENVESMRHMAAAGNGDGYVLNWLADYLRKTHRHGEVDLVIVVSDGTPSWGSALGAGGYLSVSNLTEADLRGLDYREALVRDTVTNMRAEGRYVLSVAIAHTPTQDKMYGTDAVIPFTGDWSALAADFGKALGGVLADAMRRSAR